MTTKEIIEQIPDNAILQAILQDMLDGRFYKEADDETLELSLLAIWSNRMHWHERGIPTADS